jgi:hypothetical protein
MLLDSFSVCTSTYVLSFNKEHRTTSLNILCSKFEHILSLQDDAKLYVSILASQTMLPIILIKGHCIPGKR